MKPHIALGLALLALPHATPSHAGRVDGETFFNRFPVLTRASTDQNSSTYNYARYSFVVLVPPDSGESLGSLLIGIPQRIPVPDSERVQVVDGEGRPVPLSAVQTDGDRVRLTFAQPVAPGNQVSVQFYPMRNPRIGGTYLFGVTAFPAGPTPRGQFIAYGRLQFIAPGGGHR
jgi:hypothetical protein